MKKLIVILLCAVFCATIVASFTATSLGNQSSSTSIVFLGDSIAEGVLGPAPLGERENYCYYAILGRINGFRYYNRSVSGHQTHQLIELLKEEDNGATMTATHIKNANVIHVSILGNDLLQNNLGETMLKYAQNDTVVLDQILAQSVVNFAEIVATLKELNPDALLIFQTVYNPVYNNTPIIAQEILDQIFALGYDYDDLRVMGAEILTMLNSIVYNYLEEHPGAYVIADAYKIFGEIYDSDNAKGQALIYTDGVHPSNYGHAVLAEITQEILIEHGYAKEAPAIKNYKKIKIEQLERMFASYENTDTTIKNVKNATTFREVSDAYFDGIGKQLPIYNKD